jgi:hypothetical protein
MSTVAPTAPISINDWTLQQKKQVLAALAHELLGQSAKGFVEVNDAQGRQLGFLMPPFDPSEEFTGKLTPGYFFELLRRAATPEDSVPWREMLARLDAEDVEGSQTQ